MKFVIYLSFYSVTCMQCKYIKGGDRITLIGCLDGTIRVSKVKADSSGKRPLTTPQMLLKYLFRSVWIFIMKMPFLVCFSQRLSNSGQFSMTAQSLHYICSIWKQRLQLQTLLTSVSINSITVYVKSYYNNSSIT